MHLRIKKQQQKTDLTVSPKSGDVSELLGKLLKKYLLPGCIPEILRQVGLKQSPVISTFNKLPKVFLNTARQDTKKDSSISLQNPPKTPTADNKEQQDCKPECNLVRPTLQEDSVVPVGFVERQMRRGNGQEMGIVNITGDY